MERTSLILFYGRTGCGKSSLMRHLIWLLSVREKRFNHGWVISPTAFNGDYDWMPSDKVMPEFSEDIIEQILAFQKRCLKPGFLILDDCIGHINFGSQLWARLATSGRHYGALPSAVLLI